MQGSRPARLGEQIREDLSTILKSDVRDPGIGFLTFTYVNVSTDLQVARVYYTTLGDERGKREAAKALGRATPFLRRQLASRLRLRHAPELHFHYDDSVERGQRVEQILQEIHTTPPDEATPAPEDPKPRDVQS